MIRSFLVLTFVGLAAPAWPCSTLSPLPSAEDLVRRAEVVVRVRAEGLSSTPGRPGVLGGSPTQVRFAILETLKGRLSSSTIEFNGSLSERDDPNGGPVPYGSVRPSGHAPCFALTYRTGAEYLLLLGRGDHQAFPNDLTPHWSPLGPTNEQLFGGASDAWFVWVSQQLRKP